MSDRIMKNLKAMQEFAKERKTAGGPSDIDIVSERLDNFSRSKAVTESGNPWIGSTLRTAASALREMEAGLLLAIELVESDVVKVSNEDRDKLMEALAQWHVALLT